MAPGFSGPWVLFLLVLSSILLPEIEHREEVLNTINCLSASLTLLVGDTSGAASIQLASVRQLLLGDGAQRPSHRQVEGDPRPP